MTESVWARAYRISNMYPDGIGIMKSEEPPKNFNWDMWLGPRPFRPYQYNIALEMKTRIEWDHVKERITNHDEANSLLHYVYRKPWSLD